MSCTPIFWESVLNLALWTNTVSLQSIACSFSHTAIILVGNGTSNIPKPFLNYLSALRSRSGPNRPLRLRIGGNSMDSSTYVPSQTSPMIQLTNSQANVNDQPVNYGPVLWDVVKLVAQNVGGAQYLIG